MKTSLHVLMASAVVAIGVLLGGQAAHATATTTPHVGAQVQTVQFYGGPRYYPYRPYYRRPYYRHYYGGGFYGGRRYGWGGYRGGYGRGFGTVAAFMVAMVVEAGTANRE